MSHQSFLLLFEQKTAPPRDALNREQLRSQAAEIVFSLNGIMMNYPGETYGPEVKAVANILDLLAYATNDTGLSLAGRAGCDWYGCRDVHPPLFIGPSKWQAG